MALDIKKVYLGPNEKNATYQNSAIRQLLEYASDEIHSNAPATIYVRSGGNDNNDGLAATQSDKRAGPVLTLQQAVNLAATYDANGSAITIDVGAGSFAGATFSGPARGAGSGNTAFNFVVSGAGQTSTTITANPNGSTNCFQVQLYSQVVFQHLNISVPAGGFSGIFLQDFSSASSSDIRMTGGDASAIGYHLEDFCTCEFATSLPCDFYGTFGFIATVGGTGQFLVDSGVFRIFGTVGEFVLLDGVSDTNALSTTPCVAVQGGGSVTGSPYSVFGNSRFNWNGSTPLYPNNWPASQPGIVGIGGRAFNAAASPSILTSSGSGTVTLGSAGSRGGTVTITTSSSAATHASGFVKIGFSENVVGEDEATSAGYLANVVHGTGIWNARATVIPQLTNLSSVNALVLNWDNNSSVLSSSSVYYISYIAP